MRTLSVIGIAALAIAALSTPARADIYGKAICPQGSTSPQCRVSATELTPGQSGNGQDNGDAACAYAGKPVPCYQPGRGWLGSDGCYYGKDRGGFMPADEYIKFCIDPATGDLLYGGTTVLIGQPYALDVMIRQAVSYLVIPKPALAANPSLGTPQVVNVPVWWWIQPGVWQAHTATATLPGIVVTATAEPTAITWNAGDGTTTRCTGPGTAWTTAVPANAASPTCGHTYTASSHAQPGGVYTLEATILWAITWTVTGGDEPLSGAEPGITTGATATVEVTDLRGLVTG